MDKQSATLGPSKDYTVDGLQCTHANLSKFRCPEDPSFLKVKKIIKDDIDFTTTRRLWDAISKPDVDEVKKQLLQGANFNRGNSRKQNALHLATVAGNLEIVNLLLELDVDVNAEDVDHHGPVRCALLESKHEILKVLLKRGAKVNGQDKMHVTDESCLKLLRNIDFLEGPRVNPGEQKFPIFPKERLPSGCKLEKFFGTITTFNLRSETKTEEKISSDSTPSTTDSTNVVEDEREYCSVETISLEEMLFSQSVENSKDNALSGKEWKWYHLPANNVSRKMKQGG